MTLPEATVPGAGAAAANDETVDRQGVVDQEVIDGIAAAARAVPGVREAVAVVGRGMRGLEPAVTSPRPEARPEPERSDGPSTSRAASSETYGGELLTADGAATTVQEALRQAVELAPDKGTVFLRQDRRPDFQSYPQLLADAERVLAGLRAEGLRPGDAALFQFDDHRGYMTAFWACVLGGFVPTPVAVATTYAADNAANRKLHGAWELLGQPVVLTDAATAPALGGVRTLWGEPAVRILTVEALAAHDRDHAWHPATADTTVINLLTSGSTGVPKCVQHTNASIAARTWAVIQACDLTADDVTMIWMPLDHVTMIYYNIRDVFLRCRHVNGRINDFLADPLLWLDWLERYGATNSWAPNFAYALVVQHADEIARRSWDLSRVRQLDNAGEPVIAATNHRFLDLLAPHGLRADAVAPVWGMSETCSAVTLSRLHRDERTAGTFAVAGSSMDGDLSFLDEDQRAGQDAVVVFTSVGTPLPGVTMRVVDLEGAVLPEDRIGELQIRGATMMRGYRGNSEANRAAWDPEGWFRTGDLAFVHGGGIAIAGRRKDQIVVRGTNYIAHELEYVVEEVEGVRVTFAAAAGVRRPAEGSDRLVIFFVPARWDTDSLAGVFREVRARLGREVGLAPDILVPVTEAEFRKTASGKIQRAAMVADLEAGRFDDRIEQDEEPQPPQTLLATREWTPLDQAPTAAAPGGVTVLLAADAHLASLGLDAAATVVVRPGEGYACEAPGRFRVTPGDPDELSRVLAEVTAERGPISAVVHAWSLPLPGDRPGHVDRLAEATAQLTALVKVLEERRPDGPDRGPDQGGPAAGASVRPLLLVLTTGAVHVRPGDQVDLGVCALPGLVHTAAAEVPWLAVRQLDLPAHPEAWATAVRGELADHGHSGAFAAREGQRWQRRVRPVPQGDAAGSPAVTPGGVYLVTGGLGGIARDLAGYLLAAYGVRLVLVGRSPAKDEKADALAELRGLGEVMYHQADVADAAELGAAVTAAEKHWGRPLDGVLHLAAASVDDQWADLERHALAREGKDAFTRQYAAKVAGTLALAGLLEGRPDASLTLFGSVNGEFGGRSFGAYAAASAFLAGFADHWHHERGRPVRCLAWSAWENVGMNQGRSTAPARRRGFLPITPDEGLRTFLTATALPYHYLLIGLDFGNPLILDEVVGDELSAREVLVAYAGEGTDPQAVRAALEPGLRDLAVPVRVTELRRIPRDAAGAVDTAQLLLALRRSGQKDYQAPQTDLERQLAQILAEVTGQSDVGRTDSFFDLGGTSLHATRMLAQIGERLAVRLSTDELYRNPTVAGVAAVISAR